MLMVRARTCVDCVCVHPCVHVCVRACCVDCVFAHVNGVWRACVDYVCACMKMIVCVADVWINLCINFSYTNGSCADVCGLCMHVCQ